MLGQSSHDGGVSVPSVIAAETYVEKTVIYTPKVAGSGKSLDCRLRVQVKTG
jgi:hypothetical protein